MVFLGVFFWVFLGGFFIANPVKKGSQHLRRGTARLKYQTDTRHLRFGPQGIIHILQKFGTQHMRRGIAGLKNQVWRSALLVRQRRTEEPTVSRKALSTLAPAWHRKTEMNQSFRHSERSLNACGFAGKIAANCAYFLIKHFARGEGVVGV